MMDANHFFIGGEFWEDDRFQVGRVTIPTEGMTFLNGGEAAMRLACEHLASNGISEILVPVYICSTMADAFERCGLRCTFYQVNEKFRIELDDLLKKAPRFKVLYLINYFGCGFSTEELIVFKNLKANGMLLIEDDAQALLNRQPVGDIRFNSLRKFVPHDGSFFYSRLDLSSSLGKFKGLPNRRLPVIRDFRKTFARLLEEGADAFDELNPLFDLSEKYYYEDLTVLGDPLESAAAEHLDWAAIEVKRKQNHQRLLERLADLPGIEIIFPAVSPHSLPLGFPIYVKDGRREALLNHLREENIYPLVHWNFSGDIRLNINARAAAMSKAILTLVLDQRFDLEDMDYQAVQVRLFFK
jgi:dTDP-4-amino-4,6-dideoxygalactose transaminase